MDTDQIERNRFYDLLWGDAVGYVFIAAGATGAEIVARGWPLAKDESTGPDDVHMLLWTQDTHDKFKAEGRPHTGTVFAWPSQRKTLDRYVVRLTDEYEAVYCRKFVYATKIDAKRGNPPISAQIVQVEDAPDELPAYMPLFSFTLQTSDYSRQGFYRFPTPQPWAKMKTLAECTKDRIPGADSGGPNPAQFTRIPTTTNTKEKAARFRVRLVEGQGDIEVATLVRAVLPGGMGGLSAAHSQGQRRPGNGKGGPGADDPGWCVAVETAVGWRGYLWKDAEPWKGGPQLRDDGTPKALKEDHAICRVLRGEMSWPDMASKWGGKDQSTSGFTYHLVGSLYLVGCEIPQIIALAEVLDPQARAKGDSWFYHQNLWGCLYRTGNERQGWAVLLPDIPRRPWKRFAARRVETIPDVERSRRGRKPGAQASMVDHIAVLLVPGEEITRKNLRDRLSAVIGRDVCPRSMTTYMGELAARGLVARNAARGEHYRVVGGVASNSTLINAPVNALEGGGVASNRGGSNSHRFGASQCEVGLQGDHTPPVLPGEPVFPASAGASDDLPDAPVMVATPVPSGGCDLPVLPAPAPIVTSVHHALTLGVDLTESQRLSDQLAALRARYVAEAALAASSAPEQCVPTAPERPSPAPETYEVTASVVIVAQTPVQTAVAPTDEQVHDAMIAYIHRKRDEARVIVGIDLDDIFDPTVGATFDPNYAPGSVGPERLAGRTKDTLGTDELYRAMYERCDAAPAPAPLPRVSVPDPEPEPARLFGPPRDLKKRDRYFGLASKVRQGKASDKQRLLMRSLEEPYSPEEYARMFPTRAKPAATKPAATPSVAQAPLFSYAQVACAD